LLSSDRLARIAVDSLSLWERMAAGFCFEPSATGDSSIQDRLRAWRDVVADGDEARFRERLDRDKLDIAQLQHLLGRTKVPVDFELPGWCRLLCQVIETTPRLRDATLSPDPADAIRYLKPGDPVPFEDLLLPFVEVALSLLADAGPPKLSARVLSTFGHELLEKLSEIAARVLVVEFRAFLACRQFSGDAPANVSAGSAAREQYRLFVASIYAEGWGGLLADYCVMARLLAEAVLQWVARTREFAQRLLDDLPDIERTFNRGRPSGGAVAVTTDLSDPHNGGRTVLSLELAYGLRLVYKPRSLGLERSWFDLLAWINNFAVLPPFRVLKVLDRGDYGWVEHVEHRSCAGEEEIRRYYRRAGNLLCLVHALNGSDFHFENLIADGEHPVPIDLETIFHHRAPSTANGELALDEITARLRVSVLATDLLPDPVKADHQYFDISALARSDADEGEADTVVWTQVNTDQMDYRYARQRPRPARNLPRLNGRGGVVPLDGHEDMILSGFGEAYRFLMAQAELLLAEDGPLRRMFSREARFIFRSTAHYALILRRALHPAHLRDGLDFGIQLDVLARGMLNASDTPKTWPLIQAEMAALWRLDIPRFTARGDENALNMGAGCMLAGCFVDSAWNAARAKIRNLNDEDFRWQHNLILGSLDMRSANLWTGRWVADAGGEPEEIAPLGRDELLTVATGLATEIETRAYRQDIDDLGWMALSYAPAADRYTLQPITNDLYNGRAGVALFFAALERLVPGRSYRALAHAVLRPLRRWIRLAPDAELTLGFGGYAGLSSVAYALTRAGELLGEDALIADAAAAALRIRADEIAQDQSLDAMSGCAGAIPALLACHAASGEAKILAHAVACGRRLLQTRAADEFGMRTWPTLDKRHLTGFSHGAAGIACALLQLYRATADAEFRDAAVDGIRFEQHAFVPEAGNWRDLRRAAAGPAPDPAFSMAWCHGAPGIGLGRLGTLDILDSPAIRRDIAAALTATASVGLLPRDHLCCGNAGLMETLCLAGARLAHGDWSAKARQLAARMVARRHARGSFSIAFHNGFFNPSLFQGAAGVGYQMLRLAEPATVPSVLLLG
jgi:type 2 lantibiotic biosynthesis protein LanM